MKINCRVCHKCAKNNGHWRHYLSAVTRKRSVAFSFFYRLLRTRKGYPCRCFDPEAPKRLTAGSEVPQGCLCLMEHMVSAGTPKERKIPRRSKQYKKEHPDWATEGLTNT